MSTKRQRPKRHGTSQHTHPHHHAGSDISRRHLGIILTTFIAGLLLCSGISTLTSFTQAHENLATVNGFISRKYVVNLFCNRVCYSYFIEVSDGTYFKRAFDIGVAWDKVKEKDNVHITYAAASGTVYELNDEQKNHWVTLLSLSPPTVQSATWQGIGTLIAAVLFGMFIVGFHSQQRRSHPRVGAGRGAKGQRFTATKQA